MELHLSALMSNAIMFEMEFQLDAISYENILLRANAFLVIGLTLYALCFRVHLCAFKYILYTIRMPLKLIEF
jgi:hypothetical protein